LYAGYVIGFIFLLLNTTTNYVISGSRYAPDFYRYEEVFTSLFYIFLVYFGFFIFFSIGLLINAYFKSDGIRKRQIFFITIALILVLAAGYLILLLIYGDLSLWPNGSMALSGFGNLWYFC
jgi:hypothetical protein